VPSFEYPEQTYIPSAKIRLIVRFDEFGQATRLTAKVPTKTTKNLNGVKDERGDLTVVPDPDAPQGTKRFLLQSSTQQGTGSAQKQDASQDQFTQVLGGIIPRAAEWGVNGIRVADSLKATIRYLDCPIDPRTVRSCAVEYYLGTVTAEDFQAGIRGKTRAQAAGAEVPNSAEPMNLVPDTYVDSTGKQRTNLRFQGWVDKWVVDWGESSEPTIELECVDNTRLLIDQQQPPKLVLSMEKGIDEAVATYLSHFPQLQGMTVEYQPVGDQIPVLKGALAASAFRPKLGPQPAGGGAGSDKHSIWDYLTDVCGSIGHSIRVEGTRIIIQRVRSLYTNSAQGRVEDPFQGRTLTSGTSFTFRRFIYGRNLKTMRVSRTFTRKAATNVEVRSYSTEKKTVIVARFPQAQDRLAYAIPGDASPDQKWTVFRVSGIGDPKVLRAVAQNIYEGVGRNELEVELETENLASFGGGNTDPDILDMAAADTFELLVNRDASEFSSMTKIESSLVSQAANADYFKRLGFSDGFAQAYSKAYTDAGFQTTYRLGSMTVSWDVEQIAVNFKIVGKNYIEVRADKLLPQGEEPDNTASKARPAQTSGPTPGPPGDLPPP
jgi:hypothetical protein